MLNDTPNLGDRSSLNIPKYTLPSTDFLSIRQDKYQNNIGELVMMRAADLVTI